MKLCQQEPLACCSWASLFTGSSLLIPQELSPTSDTNLVRSLMNLIDCFMDDFADETKQKERNDRETFSLLEVRWLIVLCALQ